MSTAFRRGMPEQASSSPFTAGLLPLEQKEDLCRSLLAEFGASVHSERRNDHELIHACLVSPGAHTNQDREPTASINYEKLTYKCLGCQAAGGILWFIATVRNCTTIEARQWLNSETGLAGEVMDLSLLMKVLDAIYKPKEGLPPIPRMSERMLEPWDLLHPYLTDPKDAGGRGIPEQNVIDLRIGYARDYVIGKDDVTGKWLTSERITIPHFWKGNLVGWQSRRLDVTDGTPKFLSSADFPKEQTIYHYDAKHTGRTVLVEAMFSVASKLHLEPHVEATFGANVTDEQVRLLSKHPTVVLFMDNDEAGWKAVEGWDEYWPSGRLKEHHEGLGERLGRYTTVLVVDNPYAADAADISDEDFMILVDSAIPFSIWRKPMVLLCYSCKEIAHEGPCQPGRG